MSTRIHSKMTQCLWVPLLIGTLVWFGWQASSTTSVQGQTKEPRPAGGVYQEKAKHAPSGGSSFPVEYAPQGRKWLATPGGDAQFRLLVDHANLRSRSVQVADYTQAAGSFSGDHIHQHDEVFYVTSGELINILHPGTDHQQFQVAKPGMAAVVPARTHVIHWVRSTTEPVRGLVIWAPGKEEKDLEKVGFAHGEWRAPFNLDRRIDVSDIPPKLLSKLAKPEPAGDAGKH